MKLSDNNAGLSLLEVITYVFLVGLLSGFIAQFFINTSFFNTTIDSNKQIIQEVRETLNNISKETRSGMVDYKGYYLFFHEDDYADPNENVLFYENKLTSTFPTGVPTAPESFLSQNNPSNNQVDELILLSYDGVKRTKIKREEKTDAGDTWGALFMTKETYRTTGTCALQFDGSDVYPSTHSWDTTFTNPDPCWVTNDEFPTSENNGWQQITSDDLDIQTMKFLISPNKDPWKVYEKDSIQIHPHVTTLMTVSLSPQKLRATNATQKPITIQTTTSSRIYDSLDWSISN